MFYVERIQSKTEDLDEMINNFISVEIPNSFKGKNIKVIDIKYLCIGFETEDDSSNEVAFIHYTID